MEASAVAAVGILQTRTKMSEFIAANGKYFTSQLFWEQWIELPEDRRVLEKPMFTLYRDKEGLINFGREYVDHGDPTGYDVAMKLLGNYNHWVALNQCTWFQAAREIWDEQLDAKIKADAFKKIEELKDIGQPAQQLAAAKYLANADYRRNRSATKGRPSKEEIAKEARKAAATERDLANDFQRIRAVN